MRHRHELRREDHNATSYSTETDHLDYLYSLLQHSEDHNATSYSTETAPVLPTKMSDFPAKIITLRAIALKHHSFNGLEATCFAKIITLRAIALKRCVCVCLFRQLLGSEDHNATSYSTETVSTGGKTELHMRRS